MDKFNLIQYFVKFREISKLKYKLFQTFYICLASFAVMTMFSQTLLIYSATALWCICLATVLSNDEMFNYEPKSENKQLWKIGNTQFVGTETQAIVYSVLECNDEQPELVGEVIHYT